MAGLVAGMLATALPGSARTRPGRYDASGIDGSGGAVMQPVNVGLRVSLVAAVPGSPRDEAWAVARSTAKLPGWAAEEGGGQTVFLRYTAMTGWELRGPPVTEAGEPTNPSITSLSIAPSGEGWAVGNEGAMVKLVAGRWVAAPAVTKRALVGVSVGSRGASAYGFAVGDGPTVLRLASGAWREERLDTARGEDWDLHAVSAVGPGEAWAAGASSRAALILRRSASGWSRVRTGRALFDEEQRPRTAGATVMGLTRASAVSATRGGAWVGGTMVPIDAGSSLGDPAGDPTRPFVLFFDRDGEVTTFCPDHYSIGSDGRAATNAACDEPFPLAAFGITALQAFPGRGRGEAFATGLGFFRYRRGSWFREPNPLSYLSSVGLVRPTEGWVAGTGNVVGAGSFSSIQTVGHWTRSPEPARVARWPEPVTDPATGETQPLEAVATDPEGTGRAVAVGQEGASFLYVPEVGWDSMPVVSAHALHAIAWPAGGDAWAVGGHGTIFRLAGTRWREDHASERLTTASLFGVAFSSARRGYAVGANGTILSYDGDGWAVDRASRRLTDADLFAVAATGAEFVAAGADGTVLATHRGRWGRVAGLERLLSRGGLLPALYAAAGLPDGTVFLGGELSTLIRRDGLDGGWRVDREGGRVPPEGTILALSARRADAGVHLLAGVSYETLKYSGEDMAAMTGFLLSGTSAGWRDLDHSTRMTLYDGFDASAPRDPVYGIAFDGTRAWAVGGTGAGNDDGQGHVQAFPTSSIYLVDESGDPRATGHGVTPSLEEDPTVSFAFFGETSCGRGLCGATVGSGTKADVVASHIQREINATARLPGGPKFVVFGGNMRRAGIPEELGQFRRFAEGFSVPFFGVLGSRDLFTGLEAGSLRDDGEADQQVNPDHSFYVDAFKDLPRPWGEGKPREEFVPVLDEPGTRGARTHYAFDYTPKGRRTLRIVVLDDSAPARLSTASSQNPPRDQNAWLTRVLQQARSLDLPAIIVMNRPARNPLDLTRPEDSYDEALPVQTAAAQVGASAVLTSYFRENGVLMVRVPGVASTVPVYVFGGGGAPLELRPGEPPRPPDPSLGYYHSWQLVSVDLGRKTSLGQHEVFVRSFPVVDTVAVHAIDGVRVAGGNTLRFAGSGHAPEGGGPNDPLQSKAVVVPFDFRSRGVCPPDPTGGFRPRCLSTGAVGPAYRFVSEDPSVGFFVRPSAADDRLPYLDPTTEAPVPDPSSGLFCAVGAGTTFVDLLSGLHRARMKVTVESGSGPCVKDAVVAPRRTTRVVPPAPIPRSRRPDARLTRFTRRIDPNSIPAIFPPPPLPIVAPAPPAAPGVGRKEEQEPSHETEGHRPGENKYAFSSARSAGEDRVPEPLWLLGGIVVVAFCAAAVAAGSRRATGAPAVAAFERRRGDPR